MALFSNEKSDAKNVTDLWEKGVAAQRRLLMNHQVNTSFLLGDQWVMPESRESMRLIQVPRDDDRVRLTMNRLLPATRTLMAKMHKRPLVWDVAPPSADDASVRMAKVAESLLSSTAREQDWEGTRVEVDWHTWLGGTGILSVDWDPRLGQPLKAVGKKGQKVGTGDVVVTASSIGQAVVEPGSPVAERARWWIRSLALPPELVAEMFGLQGTPAADAKAAGGGQVADVTRRQLGTTPDLTQVFWYYERPTDKGDGRVMVVAGGKVVDDKAWPFPWRDELNLAVQRETVLPGLWCGDTVMSSAVSVQAAYNQSWSSLVEHVKLAGNARLAVNEQELDLLDGLTDTPGDTVVWREQVPQWLSPPQLPQWVVDSPAYIRRELDDILGYQDISRGAAPSNIESGLGVSILAEAADTPVAQLAAEAARAWSRIGSLALKLYAQYATERRTAKITTTGKPTEQVSWTGADLTQVTEAVVPVDEVLPKSRAAQEAYATRLWELGIVQDPAIIADIADLPNKEAFITALDPDIGKQERENYEMTLGKDCEPAPFDNHKVHLDVLNRFRKSERYERADQATKARIDRHAEQHEDLSRDQQVEAVAEEAMSPTGEAPPLADGAEMFLPDPAAAGPAAGMVDPLADPAMVDPMIDAGMVPPTDGGIPL